MSELKSFSILCFLVMQVTTGWTQEDINSHDTEGKRHGYWKEYFDPNESQLKFEGEFEHGKKIGLFKFYREGLKQPVAIMDFDAESDRATAKYLSQNGKIISEGEIHDQKRVGVWTYYHKNSDEVMMTENYEEGKLHGHKKVYYDEGQLAEEANYSHGELHGPRKLYSEKGVVLEDLHYENGELHGPAKIFNGKGELMSEGVYRNNKHHGTWRYYENGELKEVKEF